MLMDFPCFKCYKTRSSNKEFFIAYTDLSLISLIVEFKPDRHCFFAFCKCFLCYTGILSELQVWAQPSFQILSALVVEVALID